MGTIRPEPQGAFWLAWSFLAGPWFSAGQKLKVSFEFYTKELKVCASGWPLWLSGLPLVVCFPAPCSCWLAWSLLAGPWFSAAQKLKGSI